MVFIHFFTYAHAGGMGKVKQQKTVSLFLEKSTRKDPGFIFHDELYNSEGVRYYSHVLQC